jgi:transglutaminase-like putative cysteine protease
VTRVELDRPHNRLQVVAEMDVRLDAEPEIELAEGLGWQRVRDQLCYNARARDAGWIDAMRYRGESPYVHIKGLFGDYARDCLLPDASVASVAAALMSKIRRDFKYAPGSTEIATPLLEVLTKRSGVCQDFAHLMIACLRSVGLSARYVSGYLRTHARGAPPPLALGDINDDDDEDDDDDDQDFTATGIGIDGLVAAEPEVDTDAEGVAPRLRGADASHAWVAVFAPPFGWLGFDPTNNVRINQDHVALAWGRDFGDVSPLRGVILGGGSHRLTVRVAVREIVDPA